MQYFIFLNKVNFGITGKEIPGKGDTSDDIFCTFMSKKLIFLVG
jgi:hypothetical protein